MFEYAACRQAASEQPRIDITVATVKSHLLDCWQELSVFAETVTC